MEKLKICFEMADMQDAVDCLNQAIADGTRICIYGDYDCDGVTSTVMLYSYLFEMGANVTYRIPEREEGLRIEPKRRSRR
ncbi:MAG: DHH family phosphoesterase [Ruminococcus sp.]